MKNSIKTFAFALFLFVCANALQAQQKIAYIYSDSLIVLMPEKQMADSTIEQFRKKYEDALARKEDDYNKKYKEYQEAITKNKGVEPIGDPLFNLLVSDSQELGQAINKLQQTAQNDVAKKTQEVYEPIIEKAKKAIAEVAKDKGYTYVIDASIGGLLYTQPNDNIIDEVKKKLKIK